MTTRLAAALIVGAGLLAAAAKGEAQPAALSERGYEGIRSMADDLDRSAQHAADAAQQSRSWFYSHDREFQRAVTNFARRCTGAYILAVGRVVEATSVRGIFP